MDRGPSYDGWGYTNLYVNDYLNDPDGDTLGSGLEAELGTCASDADPRCADWRAFDSDRDGLRDDEEVFGYESVSDPLNPQHLPRWGADPLHKDVFVEVDWNLFLGSNPFSLVDAFDVSNLYGWGAGDTSLALKNLDGQSGINLHLDIGYDSGPENTTSGDWGGSNGTLLTDRYLARDSQRRAVRRNRFRYALLQNSGGGGQASDDVFEIGAAGGPHVIAFAHELGHTLALKHWGHAAWGEVNCKPNYPSLMNYSGPPNFSRGLTTNLLNPSNFVESGLLAGPDSILFLRENPWYFFVLDPSRSVDALRDGTIDTVAVRGTLADAPYNSCGTFVPGEKIFSETTANLKDEVTPRLVKSGDRLFYFYLGGDGVVRYRHALQNGPKSKGSCPGTDTVGDGCTIWSEPLDTPLTGLQGFHVVSHHDGGLLFALWYPTNGVSVIQASVDSAGILSGWPTSATSVTTSLVSPELARVSATGNRYGLFTTHMSGAFVLYRWHTSPTGTTWTSAGSLPTLVGENTPSVTLVPPLGVPEGDASRKPCGAFTSSGRVHILCLEGSTWVDHTTTLFRDSDACAPYGARAPDPGSGTCTLGPTTLTPPSLVFHLVRTANGELLRPRATRCFDERLGASSFFRSVDLGTMGSALCRVCFEAQTFRQTQAASAT